ncbi:MAG: hypothetical protein EPO65_09660 [Dehalococcoidia bacterium]|nr:MAG: hypothetical protein EPO65_09660 [Dehalococcoidia bacterium]
MRILSLSHRLQHRQVDNHTILNAPNIADYDAIVLDIRATADIIHQAAQGEGFLFTHGDAPIVNGEGSDGAAPLAALLDRRREEFARALERGAVVAVILAPQSRITGVTEKQGLDRYFMLPAPIGMAWDGTTIRASEGSRGAVVDHAHPFVKVYETYQSQLLYRATIDDRAPGIGQHAHVFLRSAGGSAIGVDVRVGAGRIVFLPSPSNPETEWLPPLEGQAMVDAFSDALALPDDDPPYWGREMPVPGLEAQETRVRELAFAVEQAQDEHAMAERIATSLSRVRQVLWAGSESALLAAAAACAQTIGFEIARSEDGEPVWLDGDHSVDVVVASSEGVVEMSPHYRLRQRIEAGIASRAIAPRGVIVVSGQRLSRPDERSREIADSLRVASEAVGYALLPSRVLYRCALAALEGAPQERLEAMRARIASTNGIVDLDDLLK